MLNAIEDISYLEFEIMIYTVIKYKLTTHNINIISHPPKNLLTPEFYQ